MLSLSMHVGMWEHARRDVGVVAMWNKIRSSTTLIDPNAGSPSRCRRAA